MPPETKSEHPSWLNPRILRWAREWSGRSLEEAAKKIKKPVTVLTEWESGIRVPTVKQARRLAEFYDRPFLEFLLPKSPTIPEPTLVPDFRLAPGAGALKDSRELQRLQQWVETQRVNALDLFDELGESPPQIPGKLFTTIHADPDTAAAKARAALQFSFEEQSSLSTADQRKLPDILRGKLEALGILVLRKSNLKDFDVRGICVATQPLPVVVFRPEAPAGQAFTLAHELAHVLITASGITGPRSSAYNNQPIEKWCDRFAAAFLMPKQQISLRMGPRPQTPRPSITDSELESLSVEFRVSQHSMLIRLVHLGYVAADYYWNVKKPEFDKQDREYKGFGRTKVYGNRYKSTLGNLYTGLVLEAWASGRLTNHNAAEYMGIKNIRHLEDIRAHFKAGADR